MALVTLVTGASSGFGQMIARDLACAGHTVFASMRGTKGKNADKAKDNTAFAAEKRVDLRSIELDVQDQNSIEAAVQAIIDAFGRIDVLVQNAGHMVYGPTEAFTPDQLAQQYDINVLGTHRVNRAVLPHMRKARSGLLIWVSSSSVAGGVPPLLGPYFAAKAGLDALAVCYAKELAPFGIESSIVVPGAFTTGTNHFLNAGKPEDTDTEGEYVAAYPDGFLDKMQEALAGTSPKDADPKAVGRAVVDIVAAPVRRAAAPSPCRSGERWRRRHFHGDGPCAQRVPAPDWLCRAAASALKRLDGPVSPSSKMTRRRRTACTARNKRARVSLKPRPSGASGVCPRC